MLQTAKWPGPRAYLQKASGHPGKPQPTNSTSDLGSSSSHPGPGTAVPQGQQVPSALSCAPAQRGSECCVHQAAASPSLCGSLGAARPPTPAPLHDGTHTDDAPLHLRPAPRLGEGAPGPTRGSPSWCSCGSQARMPTRRGRRGLVQGPSPAQNVQDTGGRVLARAASRGAGSPKRPRPSCPGDRHHGAHSHAGQPSR